MCVKELNVLISVWASVEELSMILVDSSSRKRGNGSMKMDLRVTSSRKSSLNLDRLKKNLKITSTLNMCALTVGPIKLFAMYAKRKVPSTLMKVKSQEKMKNKWPLMIRYR